MSVATKIEYRVKRLLAPWPQGAPSREIYLAIAELLRRDGLSGPPSSLDLGPYELKVFSQNGEDGVLAEILRRIGPGSRTFVEFGTEAGVEANLVYLADVRGWSGHFIEGDPGSFADLSRKYASNAKVVTTNAFVTPEDIEDLFARSGVPAQLDVLSIDVDGQDYWIWKALEGWRPRVVIVEYNASLGAEPRVQPRGAPGWQGTSYYGSSCAALAALGTQKGYRLVHTDLTGVNAFFVRDDLAGDFLPESDVTHRAPNFDLAGRSHSPGTGSYETV